MFCFYSLCNLSTIVLTLTKSKCKPIPSVSQTQKDSSILHYSSTKNLLFNTINKLLTRNSEFVNNTKPLTLKISILHSNKQMIIMMVMMMMRAINSSNPQLVKWSNTRFYQTHTQTVNKETQQKITQKIKHPI